MIFFREFIFVYFVTGQSPPGGVGKLPNCESADVKKVQSDIQKTKKKDLKNEMECKVKPKQPIWPNKDIILILNIEPVIYKK